MERFLHLLHCKQCERNFVSIEEAISHTCTPSPPIDLKAEIAVISAGLNDLGPGSGDGERLKQFYNYVIRLNQLSK